MGGLAPRAAAGHAHPRPRSRLEGTWLEARVDELYASWSSATSRCGRTAGCPTNGSRRRNVPGIAIPFYLAHPRLIRLERSMMLEAEGASARGMHAHPAPRGGTRDAARLPPASAARATSGCSASRRRSIPTSYRPKPTSRHYVQHLRAYYAQAHPDEDFAETFAVWLQPRARVAEALRGVAGAAEARVRRRADGGAARHDSRRCGRASASRRSPSSRRRCASTTTRSARSTPSTTRARTTTSCVASSPTRRGTRTASSRRASSRATRRRFARLVARWTGESEFTIDQLLQRHDRAQPPAQASRAGRGRAGAARLRRHARRALRALPLPPPGVDSAMSAKRRRVKRRRMRVLVLLETGTSRPTTSSR